MNHTIRSLSLTLVAGLALGLGGAPAAADDAMTGAAMDCSKADSMMMSVMKPDSSAHESAMHDMKPTGSVDKDFAQMMMMHHQAMVTVLKTEAACGKDPKGKALAQKMLDQASIDDKIIQDLLKNDAKL